MIALNPGATPPVVNENERIIIADLSDYGLEMEYDPNNDILMICGVPWQAGHFRRRGERNKLGY